MSGIFQKLFGTRKLESKDSREDESYFFLSDIRGVIHIGANYGQERDLYAKYKLAVLWVECLPDVFQKLQENLRDFPNQKAVRYLLTDQNDREYSFHVSSNEGAASSSIFEFDKHKEIWPDVHMVGALNLRSLTLPAMLAQEKINARDYDAIIMDTQGSELLILQGARDLLPNFRFVKTEVADFQSYQGSCVLGEFDDFMSNAGFERVFSKPFAQKPGIGSYFEVVYRRR